MPEFLPLNALRCGDIAEVAELVGSAEQVRRLEELGLRAGARLEMVQCGTPCIVRVNGTTLCFRDCASLRVLMRTRKTA
jgi:ferrous iron transport protein A